MKFSQCQQHLLKHVCGGLRVHAIVCPGWTLLAIAEKIIRLRPRQVPTRRPHPKASPRTSPDEAPITGSGLGKHRRVIEQTTALLHWFRRLRIR